MLAGLAALTWLMVYVPAAQAAPPLCFGQTATIEGSSGDDVINGTNGNDVIVGRDGDDVIHGLGGEDWLCGEKGNDSIFGEALVSGGNGNDDLHASGFAQLLGGHGDDLLDGGSTPDNVTASYPDAPRPVDANLVTGVGSGEGTDTLINIVNVFGSDHADTLTGNSLDNFFIGGAGGDTIYGGGNSGDNIEALLGQEGDDLLYGQTGDDQLFPGPGDDAVGGGLGTDSVEFGAEVTADLSIGEATGEGTDSLHGIQIVLGSQFDDTLIGNGQRNLIDGREGVDNVHGRGGDDSLNVSDFDESGGDTVDGGSGLDSCRADPEDTVLNCET